MSDTQNRLYNLLPVYYRQRDADVGEPLRALLQVVSEQVDVVESNISQLYENWFIETCEEWVVPYLADLVGFRLAPEAGEPGDIATAEGRLRNRLLVPRQDVANTLRYRRRKGTLALLESLSRDIASWPARAVEFGRLLGTTQSMHHLRMERGRFADMHAGNALDLLDSPFDLLPHTIDVRRTSSARTAGRYAIASVGLFVFRMMPYSITRAEAHCVDEGDDAGENCFTVSPLGNDSQLFKLDAPPAEQACFSGDSDLPGPIRRRAFEERVPGRKYGIASATYYGEGKSLAIWPGRKADRPIPREAIIPADLTGWRYRPPARHVAVDPTLGRICFHPGDEPPEVIVSYHYGFSADIGGGEYNRSEFSTVGERIYTVSSDGGEAHGRIGRVIHQWQRDRPDLAVIEIVDSQTYDEGSVKIELHKHQCLVIRAAQGARPVIRILDTDSGRAESITIDGAAGGVCVFDGVAITGRGVDIKGGIAEVRFRHCTLVPGWGLHADCRPRHAGFPSILISKSSARVTVEHSIIGGIKMEEPQRENEPVDIHISDSIVDAGSNDSRALWDQGSIAAWATLTMLRSTVLGQIQVHAIQLAENCIFAGMASVARRQHGCVRFCYLPPGSLTPKRYNCQPDTAARNLTGDEKTAVESETIPAFNSTRYGTAAYCQLADNCASALRNGADDESEMGVFHDLFQAQRLAGLRVRLQEYVPAGCQVGILLTS